MTSGLALIDKPAGVTSHDVVAQLRKSLNTKKIGHAGTLDPMATGLLILGVGQATRLMQFFLGLDKSYRATVMLGASTTTDDKEGEILSTADASKLGVEQVLAALKDLTGEQLQVPSRVSAKKVAGKRAYERVRDGEEFTLEPKPVTISRIEVMGDIAIGESCEFEIEVDCSSGTYIRAIARDLGEKLGVGGHLTALRRRSVGPFRVDQAAEELIPPAAAAEKIMDTIQLAEQEVVDLRHGKQIPRSIAGLTAALAGEELVAILEPAGDRAKSVVVFAGGSDA